MDTRPSLKSLYAFAAVAESGSMSEAADLLCVSHSAISQSIKSLESQLSTKLFERANRSVVLNAKGKRYYKQIAPALEQIDNATQALVQRNHSHHLTLNMVNSLAMHWWIPRVDSFNQFSNKLDVRISNLIGSFSLEQEGVDVALIHGSIKEWGHYHCEKLADDELVMVASPELIHPDAPLEQLIQQHPAIIANNKRRANDWAIWCKSHQVSVPQFGNNLSFLTSIQALQATIRQLGLFITHRVFVRDFVQQGLLVELGDPVPTPEQEIHFVCQKEQLNNEYILLLRAWLKKEFN